MLGGIIPGASRQVRDRAGRNQKRCRPREADPAKVYVRVTLTYLQQISSFLGKATQTRMDRRLDFSPSAAHFREEWRLRNPPIPRWSVFGRASAGTIGPVHFGSVRNIRASSSLATGWRTRTAVTIRGSRVDQLQLLLAHPAGYGDQKKPERVQGFRHEESNIITGSPAVHGPVGDLLQIYADRFSGHYGMSNYYQGPPECLDTRA